MNFDTGSETFWNRGSPLEPYSISPKATSTTFTMTYWNRGAAAVFTENQAISPTAETGTGTDASAVTVGTITVNVSDSGTGTDASTLAAVLSSTESSTGTDASTRIIDDQTLNVTDSGAADDVSTLTAVFTGDDTGTGTDVTREYHADTDTGIGIDATFLRAGNFPTDLGIGTEASTLTVRLTRTDSGASTDDAELNGQKFITRTDTGHGAESKTLTVIHSRSEAGAVTDKAFFPRFGTDAGSSMDASVLHANIGHRASTGAFVTRQYNNSFHETLAPVPTYPTTQIITLSQNVAAGNKLVLTIVHNSDVGTIDNIVSSGLVWKILGAVDNDGTLVLAYADVPSGASAGYGITIHYNSICTRQAYVLDELTGVIPGDPADLSIDSGGISIVQPTTVGSAAVPGPSDVVLGHFAWDAATNPSDWTPGAGYQLDVVQPGSAISSVTGPAAITEYKNGASAHIVANAHTTEAFSHWVAAYTIWDGIPSSVALDTAFGDDSGTAFEIPTPTPPPPAHGFIVLRGRMTIKAGIGVLS